MNIFKGFNLKYRSYHIITPQTGLFFDVRGLTVSEVDKIRNSSVVPSKIRSVINDVIWGVLQKKPDHIKNINDFKKSITLKDREAILYGIYHSTWANNKEFIGQCSSCGLEQVLKIHIDKMFSLNPYPFSEDYKKSYELYKAAGGDENIPDLDKVIYEEKNKNEEEPKMSEDGYIDPPKEKKPLINEELLGEIIEVKSSKKKKEEKVNKFDILSKRIEVKLPESGIYVILKQPTVADEDTAYLSSSFIQKNEIDMVGQTLMIDKFEEREDSGEVNIVDNRTDIIYGFQSLPVLDRREIFNRYQEEFGKYQIELKSNWNCENCGEANILALNIAAHFFRMVHDEA